MANPPKLDYGRTYHIYNRGTDRTQLFREERNYAYFLKHYAHHVEPAAQTFAYCLMGNHFHALVRIRMPEEQQMYAASHDAGTPFRLRNPSRQWANLFSSYAKGFNATYERTGSLFEHPFRRIEVTQESHLLRLVVYIHRNPQHHGFVDDFRQWTYSSYAAILSNQPTHLQRDTVLGWFGDVETFKDAHFWRDEDENLEEMWLE